MINYKMQAMQSKWRYTQVNVWVGLVGYSLPHLLLYHFNDLYMEVIYREFCFSSIFSSNKTILAHNKN